MKKETQTRIDDQQITNTVHTDEDGEVMLEEVICETGSFPVLRLVSEKE